MKRKPLMLDKYWRLMYACFCEKQKQCKIDPTELLKRFILIVEELIFNPEFPSR